MGKGQSKQGECYLVNAHFNPLCQLEESNSFHSIETPLASQDSGLQLTPEISFTLSDENRSQSEKNITAKCDLEVFLPHESVNAALRDSIIDLKIENPGDSAVKDKQVMKENVQSSNPSNQEFSFVLKNGNTSTKTEKEDVGEVMLRSICDALKTSLKLPPSGTHTIKVHLTVSPDNKSDSADEYAQKVTSKSEEPNLLEDNLFIDSSITLTPTKSPCSKSKPITPIAPEETPRSAKYANVFAKCCQQDGGSMKLPHSPARNLKPGSSPSLQAKSKILAHRKEARKWLHASELGRTENNLLNMKNSPRHSTPREKRHHCHVQKLASGECSHYLDLADLKSSLAKESPDWSKPCDQRYINPAYCSPRHIEKAHLYCRSPKETHLEHSTPKSSCRIKQALQNPDMHTGLLKYKLLHKAKDNLLDLSFDLCDLEEKQTPTTTQETHHNQHRRSRSQETNQYMYTNSPKLRHRTCNCTKCDAIPVQNYEIPMSPSRHHRHRHKEREKDKIRAMQQVVNWLKREDLSHTKQEEKEECNHSETCSQNDTVIERHEYHHIHEHHHYYHYVNS